MLHVRIAKYYSLISNEVYLFSQSYRPISVLLTLSPPQISKLL